MSERGGAIALGGFLLGLGVGYLYFRQIVISDFNAAWLIIILGVAIILSAALRAVSPRIGLHRIVGGVAGGLVLALILTQGLNIFNSFGFNNGVLPYSTTQTKTYAGETTSDNITLKLGSMNGEITVKTWNKQEFSIVSTITARGVTQAQADENYANLPKDLVNTGTTSLQSLTLLYNSGAYVSNPYQIDVEVTLPNTAVIDLDLSTSNGPIEITDINGGTISLSTSNGDLSLGNVKADKIIGGTSNNQISGSVQAPTCSLRTSNSQISIQIGSQLSGDYILQTSNSAIDVTLGGNAGYKLDASTSNSAVTFDIQDFNYTVNTSTSKAGQTQGFDSAQVKISVDAQTSNSQIRIHR